MQVLGLTGGIASGKSTVAAMFKRLGAGVVDADLLAREAVEKGSPGLAEVVRSFGPSILVEDGSLDRKALGRLVFANQEARRKLEGIVHPRVFAFMRREIALAEAEGAELLLLDIPLLYETGARYPVSAVVVVWVDRETQLARLMGRDGIDRGEAEQRLRSQLPLDEKKRRADHVIDNRYGRSETEGQVRELWRSLRKGGRAERSNGQGALP